MKKYLGSPTDIDVERLQVEYEKLKDENIRLKKTCEELKKQVIPYFFTSSLLNTPPLSLCRLTSLNLTTIEIFSQRTSY